MDNPGSRIRTRAGWALVLALPAIWTGYLTFHYGVDIPFEDQWVFFAPLLKTADAGTLRLEDVFGSFNGHRLVFPKLLMLSLAKLTHWNVRSELLVIWLLACACAVNLWCLARVTEQNRSQFNLWCLFGAYVLLFNPTELEIWTRGDNIIFMLPLACATTCLWVARTMSSPINFLLTMLLCVVCTFSLAGGILSWVVTFPLLWSSWAKTPGCRRIEMGTLWFLFFLSCALAHLRMDGAWVFGADDGPLKITREPVKVATFFLTCLGSAFANGTITPDVPGRPTLFRCGNGDGGLINLDSMNADVVAQASGVVLLGMAAVVVTYLWRNRKDSHLVAGTLPWMMLGLYSLGNVALVTVGRWPMGNSQALSSRYLTFSSLLPISLLFLIPSVFEHWRQHTNRQRETRIVGGALLALGTGLVLLHGLGLRKTLDDWREVQHHRLAGKATLLLCNIVEEPEMTTRLTLLPPPAPQEEMGYLDRIGYLRPPLVKTNAIRNMIGPPSRYDRPYGEITTTETESGPGPIQIAGWSILPYKSRPADMVLLTYDDTMGEPIIFALAEVGTAPPAAVMARLKHRAYRHSGWNRAVDVDRLPPRAHTIRAWAFDAEDCRAYPIKGRVNLVR